MKAHELDFPLQLHLKVEFPSQLSQPSNQWSRLLESHQET